MEDEPLEGENGEDSGLTELDAVRAKAELHTPEFELDADSVDRAGELAETLVRDIRFAAKEVRPSPSRPSAFLERHYTEQARGTPIHGVLANAWRIAAKFAVAVERGMDLPGMKLTDDSFALVAMSTWAGSPVAPHTASDLLAGYLRRYGADELDPRQMIDWFLASVAISAVCVVVCFLRYSGLLGIHTYTQKVATAPAYTVDRRILGGRWLLPDAELRRQQLRIDIQTLLEGAAYKADLLWSRESRQWVKQRVLSFFILTLVFGTSALAGASVATQVILTERLRRA